MKIGESKISQRGSVVLPKVIREMLRLEEGEYIEWHVVTPRQGEVNITVIKKGA